jgi:ectoine hydroxylase-related dioxygenase (phytanoyl-CoA dioxygenase family)
MEMGTIIMQNAILEHFETYGYAVVEDLLDPARDLQPLMDDYAAALNEWANLLFSEGLITSTYDSLPFNQRFIAIVSESKQPWAQFFDISLPPKDVTEETPIHLSKSVFNLLRSPRILDMVSQIIGSEILSNPIQHVRIKPPERTIPPEDRRGLAAQTGWHQDQGVALPEADESDVLTVWFPVTDATLENGCLQVIPGSHRGDLTTHCPGGVDGGLHIPDKLLGGQPVSLPMRRGSVLLMHRRTKHASLPNTSADIRWSFDLRYQPIGQPTGRPALPGFIARSQQNPEQVMADYDRWVEIWKQARSRLAEETANFYRWQTDSPACA